MNVYVFKTDVEEIAKANQAADKLNQYLQLNDVHFDLEDCDKILRIEANNLTNGQIEFLMKEMGHFCTAL